MLTSYQKERKKLMTELKSISVFYSGLQDVKVLTDLQMNRITDLVQCACRCTYFLLLSSKEYK